MAQLKVYHLTGAWQLFSISPFCLKLDSFLRMTGIPHEAITAPSPFGGPKKKAPWIEYEGKKLGDSAFIMDFLKRKFGKDPDDHLSQQARGQGIAIQRLVEEHLYWAMVYDRWCRDENWPMLKDTVLGQLPGPAKLILPPIARRNIRAQLKGHGIGLHSSSEIEELAQRDIDALAGILGEQTWFHGDTISMTDATVYSVLANIAFVEFHSPMKGMIAAHENLTAWLNRFSTKVYP